MAVDPHSSATRRTMRAAPESPRSRPPDSAVLSAPRSPAAVKAWIDSAGKAPSRSTDAAWGATPDVHTRSSMSSYVSGVVVIFPSRSADQSAPAARGNGRLGVDRVGSGPGHAGVFNLSESSLHTSFCSVALQFGPVDLHRSLGTIGRGAVAKVVAARSGRGDSHSRESPRKASHRRCARCDAARNCVFPRQAPEDLALSPRHHSSLRMLQCNKITESRFV